MSGARAELDETLTVEILWKIGCWYIYIYIYNVCVYTYIDIHIYIYIYIGMENTQIHNGS